jgi:CRP/FNR family cyclic AMP-dependent transcriptional regulator
MSKSPDFVTMLGASAFFQRLGSDALASIASLCATRVLAADELLFQKGDPGDALFGIRRGRIRISSGTEAGRAMTLNILGSGDVFGEIALLDGRPRTAEARALEHTELFALRRHDFLKFLGGNPPVALGVIELLCDRLRWMSDRVEETAFASVEARLARRVLMLAEDYGSEVEISQEQLGHFVGVSRERVNRQLRRWKLAGLVSVGRNRIGLLDSRRLSALCGEEAA